MRPAIKDIADANGIYRTEAQRISFWHRAFPTLAFYRRFIAIVFEASAKAKRGEYDEAEWYGSCRDIVRGLESVGISFEISGMTHLARLRTPCVVVANHMSVLETVILPLLLVPYKQVTYVVKESLLDYPVFKYVMRSRDPIAVGRSNPRADLKAILTGGVERLERGTSIIVFPQTTRTQHFDPHHFNSIGVKLAQRAKVPMLPLVLKTDAWGQGKLLKDFGKIDPSRTVHFAFGEPIVIQGRGTEEQERIIAFMAERLRSWQAP